MPSGERNRDDLDRAVTAKSETYNWRANGGNPPPDGEYVAEFERFVETDPGDPPGAALHVYDEGQSRDDLVGVGVVVTTDVPELTREGRENEVVFRAELRDGRITDLGHAPELEAERTADLYEILGRENPQDRTDDHDDHGDLVDDLADRNRDE